MKNNQSVSPLQAISEQLKSPSAQDLLFYAQSIPYQLVQDNAFFPVMSNRGFLTPDEMQQMSSSEKKARFALCRDLQFTNQFGLKSIVATTFKPATQVGKLALENLLASDNTDWEVTKNRQLFIKKLVNSPDLLTRLKSALGELKEYEKLSLLRFAPVNAVTEAANNMMSLMFYGQLQFMILLYSFIPEYREMASMKVIGGAQAVLVSLFVFNRYVWPWLSRLDIPNKIVSFISRVMYALVPVTLLKFATYDLFYTKSGPLYWLAQKLFINMTATPSWQGCLLIALYAFGLSAFLMYKFVTGYKESVKEFDEINGLAKFIVASRELREAVNSDALGAEFYKDAFVGMSASWTELEKRAANHKNSSGPNLLCTSNSNINNMLKLTKETGADAARAIQFYGEVDAYVSMAQFVVDHQVIQNNAGEPIRVCYSEFIENSHESILSAVNVWHPIISSGSVRPSSITLGGSPANPRNAVVTGPNAAGKSVSLKSLLVNSIMAQTFGIACAESFKLTPFTKIIGRLNAPDDTASDHSKFMLEALDVVSMLTQLKSLKPTEHAFVVTDELFSGTEVGPAIELSKKLCKRVGEMKNVMYMLATHYKDLTSLKDATGNAFENYKVSVTKRADGSLDYPFKLTRGVGSTNVAFDIFLQQMNQQGLGDDDLKNMIIDARRAQETQEAT